MMPVFLRKMGKWSEVRVDFGATLGGKPLFGEHKTWRGMIGATVAGGLVWMGQVWLYNHTNVIDPWYFVDFNDYPIWTGFVLGFGAMFGDLIKSFFKRRFDVKSGKKWVPWDQIDYIIGGLAAGQFILPFTLHMWVIILFSGFFFHLFINWIGYELKLKEHPW